MMDSARRHGIIPLLYGLNAVMEAHSGNIQGPDVIELLERRTEKIIMAVDCADVLFLTDAEEILTKFESLNTELIYSTERECWPNIARTWEILNAFDGYSKCLNAGGWIGHREYAIHCLKEAIRLYRHNPPDKSYDIDGMQAWMANVIAYGGPNVGLDRNCVIFQTTSGISLDDLQYEKTKMGKRLYNTVTNTYPCVVHFNGDKSRTSYLQCFKELYGDGKGT